MTQAASDGLVNAPRATRSRTHSARPGGRNASNRRPPSPRPLRQRLRLGDVALPVLRVSPVGRDVRGPVGARVYGARDCGRSSALRSSEPSPRRPSRALREWRVPRSSALRPSRSKRSSVARISSVSATPSTALMRAKRSRARARSLGSGGMLRTGAAEVWNMPSKKVPWWPAGGKIHISDKGHYQILTDTK